MNIRNMSDQQWAEWHQQGEDARRDALALAPTEENQDWNREVADHISRRDDGWDMTRIITHYAGGIVVAWSVARPDRVGWLDAARQS